MVKLNNLLQYFSLGQSSFQSTMLASNFTAVAIAVHTLPVLPYSYSALEPYISSQVMELHHSKHHQAYVDNLNAALSSYVTALLNNDIPAQIRLQSIIRFNGGGHINHSLFWRNLAPSETPETDPVASAPRLVNEIERTWGGLDEFKETFAQTALGIQGSGWCWLVGKQNGRGGLQLAIVTTKDQDPIVDEGMRPLLGVDMWEHAYYLQYLNGKTKYLENIWNVINWKTAEERFLGASKEEAF
ncbi:uncharacterized protein CTHT_0068710 [Thermochaetoides thermophila DSM 1495]|uniref:Superoxide dismutase n=1 Tax=Chaetomium thermophilum (strain DSM 1495 / CBS 144.50 / IMI 039719) TaxID=759272 RepID=G0SH51_CHATD|nr:hypothetical protein CTHT_0068710 [Thermochaetoides thermophila DSM 1495]EGS17540.1 hypothetical protein CTHT_0068710 [Thermochaetoides thermophila DSM 1495]